MLLGIWLHDERPQVAVETRGRVWREGGCCTGGWADWSFSVHIHWPVQKGVRAIILNWLDFSYSHYYILSWFSVASEKSILFKSIENIILLEWAISVKNLCNGVKNVCKKVFQINAKFAKNTMSFINYRLFFLWEGRKIVALKRHISRSILYRWSILYRYPI